LPDNPHSLHEQVENSVTYTGTHDNDTTLGWFESLDDGAKHWIMEQLTPLARDKIAQANLPEELLLSMPWPLIIAGLESVASRVIVPMQDFLRLDSSQRMNVPGTSEGNWGWQFDWSQVPEELAIHIKTLVFHSNRLGDLHEK